jgi:3-hydroxybenzoate 6-monooxygenase
VAEILIAGGGTGVLAAVLGVARQGHWITVLGRQERSAELAGRFQLASDAFHALNHLGIRGMARDRAVFIDELRFMDGTTGRCMRCDGGDDRT